MEMEISIQNSLCRGFRACGMTKSETHLLMNDIMKWYSSNGPEWTNDRIKAYKAWYESYQAGHTEPPDWFRKSRKNLPTGIWGRVFKMKNPARVFAVLSANTCFINRKITKTQKDKFLRALAANPIETKITEIAKIRLTENRRWSVPLLQVTPPSFDDISGKSIPISSDEGKLYIRTEDDIVLAYAKSWQSVPLPTLRYLRDMRELQQVPPGLLNEGGVDGLFAILPEQEREVGFIGCIQQPGLKARWVANTHRISQHYLRPLGEDWYKMARHLASDCTFDQESGVRWVQEQLKQGQSLSGVDLTSATDLLDRKLCVDLILRYHYGMDYQEMNNSDNLTVKQYARAVTHFLDISAGEWVFPTGGTVSWNRGQPLGSHPSFALLTVTNNLIARTAERNVYGKTEPFSHFRVIGDDIIMHSSMVIEYCRLIELMGGEINHSKTLTSDRVAEFAGRIITSTRSFNKNVKFQDMSDNSFMSIMSSLGEQAKSLLRPRQRRVYEQAKYIPGIVVPGPYSQNSLGFPLEQRYDWYLNYSGFPSEKLAPDEEFLDSFQFCRKIYYKLESEGILHEYEYSVPYLLAEDFQSSLATVAIESTSGDPRLRDFNGKTALQVLEEICTSDTYMSFAGYISTMRSNLLKKISELDDKINSYQASEWLRQKAESAGVKEPEKLSALIEFKQNFLVQLEKVEQSYQALQPGKAKPTVKESLEEKLQRIEREKTIREATRTPRSKHRSSDRER